MRTMSTTKKIRDMRAGEVTVDHDLDSPEIVDSVIAMTESYIKAKSLDVILFHVSVRVGLMVVEKAKSNG